MPAEFVRLCHLDQLSEGQAQGIDPFGRGRDILFVVRQGQQLYAYRNDCPHWPGSPMAWKKNAYLSFDDSHIVCHGHGAKFDIASGKCFAGPCFGQSLQALMLSINDNAEVSILTEDIKAENS